MCGQKEKDFWVFHFSLDQEKMCDEMVFDPYSTDLLQPAPRHTLAGDTCAGHGPMAICPVTGLMAVACDAGNISVFASPFLTTFAFVRMWCPSYVTHPERQRRTEIVAMAFAHNSDSMPLLIVSFVDDPVLYVLDLVSATDDTNVCVGKFSVPISKRRPDFRPISITTKGSTVAVLCNDSVLYLYRLEGLGWEHLGRVRPPVGKCCKGESDRCLMLTVRHILFDRGLFVACVLCTRYMRHWGTNVDVEEPALNVYLASNGELRKLHKTESVVEVSNWSSLASISCAGHTDCKSCKRRGYVSQYLLTFSKRYGDEEESRIVCTDPHSSHRTRTLVRGGLSRPAGAIFVPGLGVVVRDENRVQVFMTAEQVRLDAQTEHRVAWMLAVVRAICARK